MKIGIAIALATIGLAGCKSDEGIVLCLDPAQGGPDEVSGVFVAFLEDPDGPICSSWVHEGPLALPECFAARPGDRFGYAMAVKVHWAEEGCWREMVVPFQKDRVVEASSRLPACPADPGSGCNCVGDCTECLPEPPAVFDDTAMIMETEPCQPGE